MSPLEFLAAMFGMIGVVMPFAARTDRRASNTRWCIMALMFLMLAIATWAASLAGEWR